MPVRFGPAARLRSRGEFTGVQTQGRRVAGRYLTMLAHPNSLNRHRLGIIASKRVGGAVERNRAKRRLRALFRAHVLSASPTADPRTAFDVVAIAKPDLVAAPFAALSAEFLAAWRKLAAGR
jgi:ribonuclease P protein component